MKNYTKLVFPEQYIPLFFKNEILYLSLPMKQILKVVFSKLFANVSGNYAVIIDRR